VAGDEHFKTELYKDATKKLGLHAHPVAVGVNTIPYRGRPASTYCAWSNGFGSFNGDKWDPSLTSIPEALATGNLDLRTHCRVIRIGTVEQSVPNTLIPRANVAFSGLGS
jgi:gluconate 2-dehydrogenase alpha chain